MKIYYNIYFKSPSMDAISMPEDKYLKVRDSIVNQEDTLIEFNDQTFRPRDVRYVKRMDRYEGSQPQHEVPEISEEERQENLNRLTVLRAHFFSHPGPKWVAPEWVNPYSDPVRATMTREELRAFDKEFFDVPFTDHDARTRAIAKWLPYHRGYRDPRTYRREACLVSR